MATEKHETLIDPVPGEPLPQPRDQDDVQVSMCCAKTIVYAIFFLIIAAIIGSIVWAVIGPHISVYVESASLTSLELSSDGTLHHNLSVELNVTNPTFWDGNDYTWVEAAAYYNGSRFHRARLYDFFIGFKKTVVLTAAMAGAAQLHLGPSGMELYNRQRRAGAFDLEVRLQYTPRDRSQSRDPDDDWWPSARTYTCFLPGLRLGATGGFLPTKCI